MDKRKLIISMVILAAIVLIVIFLISPQVTRIKSLKSEINNLKSELSRKTELAETINNLISKYNELVNKIQKLDLVIPKEQEKPELIVQIESLAKETGLIVESIAFKEVSQKETSETRYKILNISLNLSGNYQAFKNFLVALEQNIRIMDVQAINFSSPEKVAVPGLLLRPEQSDSELKFNVQLNTYYQ